MYYSSVFFSGVKAHALWFILLLISRLAQVSLLSTVLYSVDITIPRICKAPLNIWVVYDQRDLDPSLEILFNGFKDF